MTIDGVEIESVRVLNVHPGDIICVRMGGNRKITAAGLENIQKFFAPHRTLLMEQGTSVEIIRPSEGESASQEQGK